MCTNEHSVALETTGASVTRARLGGLLASTHTWFAPVILCHQNRMPVFRVLVLFSLQYPGVPYLLLPSPNVSSEPFLEPFIVISSRLSSYYINAAAACPKRTEK